MEHEHDWGPFTNLPASENSNRYRQCKTCSKIGYIKNGPMKTSHPKNVFVYKCHVQGCGADAVDRLPGRIVRGALRWVCEEHKKIDGG